MSYFSALWGWRQESIWQLLPTYKHLGVKTQLAETDYFKHKILHHKLTTKIRYLINLLAFKKYWITG